MCILYKLGPELLKGFLVEANSVRSMARSVFSEQESRVIETYLETRARDQQPSQEIMARVRGLVEMVYATWLEGEPSGHDSIEKAERKCVVRSLVEGSTVEYCDERNTVLSPDEFIEKVLDAAKAEKPYQHLDSEKFERFLTYLASEVFEPTKDAVLKN